MTASKIKDMAVSTASDSSCVLENTSSTENTERDALPIADQADTSTTHDSESVLHQHKYQRLKYLLEKTTIYSQFLADKMKKHQLLQQNHALGDSVEHQDPSSVRPNNSGCTAAASVGSSPFRQPKLITGGSLRPYQLEGVEWLTSLYENGLNGILADEMGLGKTLQCIGLLAFLREKGVWGPFLIVAPLSTLANWISEFRRFVPAVPVLLYHGSSQERAELRTKHMQHLSSNFPTIITSYEIVMNDQKHLDKFRWKYIIVDEGHRIKNLNCKLIRILKTYHSANRLLLTGTPLQNNLSELWSLLNFLLPDIFDDLESFQNWFDVSELDNNESHEAQADLGPDAKAAIITSLHVILKPFLLRRLKVDVECGLPKKKEFLILAPMVPRQIELYQAALAGNLRHYLNSSTLHDRARQKHANNADKQSKKRKAASASFAKHNERKPEQTSTTRDHVYSDKHADLRRCSKRTAAVGERHIRYLKDTMIEDSDDDQFITTLSREIARTSEPALQNPVPVGKATRPESTSLRLQNIIMQLRKVCNHPYLFDYPYDPQTDKLIIDERLVLSSGKMRLLDQLLPALLKEGHKVLIFSQMTKMLDILGDYLNLRHIKYYRIDGSVSQEDRARQV